MTTTGPTIARPDSAARLLGWLRSGATAQLRGVIALAALALGLAALGGLVLVRERQIAAGHTVLLPLDEFAVGDDSIDLHYPLISSIGKRENVLDWVLTGFDNRVYNMPVRGQLVLKLDEHGVLLYGRPYGPGDTVWESEILVNYHRTPYEVYITPERMRFPAEQHAVYAAARYAEIRVGPDGQAALVGFRDEARAPVGAALFP